MGNRTPSLVKQLTLALVGQALPNPETLRSVLKDFRKGILALVITGVLTSAFILLACYGLYVFLVMNGLVPMAAIAISVGIILLLSLVFALNAERHMRRAERAKERLTPSLTDEGGQSPLEDLAYEFLSGLTGKDEAQKPPRHFH